jgi:hypothetical protein
VAHADPEEALVIDPEMMMCCTLARQPFCQPARRSSSSPGGAVLTLGLVDRVTSDHSAAAPS